MHIYSIEVEDSQTCHDFWEKNKCIVVNMNYLNDNSKLVIIGAKEPTPSTPTRVCLVEKRSVL
jgi:hypothetical protein